MSGNPSTVNENKPFMALSILDFFNSGIIFPECLIAPSHSFLVKSRTEGITLALSKGRISFAFIGSGLCPYQPTPKPLFLCR